MYAGFKGEGIFFSSPTFATGVSPSMMGVGGAAFLLKSTTISRALSSRFLQLHQLCSRSISLLYSDSSPLEMRFTRVVSSANFRSLTNGWRDVQLWVYRENMAGHRTQPYGKPVLVDLELVNTLPQLHPLRPVGQEVGNPLTGRDRHLHQG